MKNRLKELILAKCEAFNKTRKPRQTKMQPIDEIRIISRKFRVSIGTIWFWYRNDHNPGNRKIFMKLPRHFGLTIDEFYIDE